MFVHPRYTERPPGNRQDLHNLRRIGPYIWQYRGRVVLALLALFLAKLAGVGVPLLLKAIVDRLDGANQPELLLPLGLLAGYGLLRLAATAFNELRDALFARVRFGAMATLSKQVLEQLHRLSLRFHLERRTGNISRDLERGANSISLLLNYLVFNILPSFAELCLVALILTGGYPPQFALAVLVTVAVYVGFTLAVTEWRMHFRHTMNRLDSEANGQAIDSLLNYETVKYFTNEAHELRRYGQTLGQWEEAAVRSQTSMGLLNFGQGAIIALGMTALTGLAAQGVVQGELTLGDLVLVNTMMLQLFLPLNFLGTIYRMLKYALADMDMVLRLLAQSPEVSEREAARPLTVTRGEVRFAQVGFAYRPERPILHDVDFILPPGSRLAVVGPSGAGKSTLARLIFRFYDVTAGQILIDGQDIREVTQDSLRRAIGIVPQDTVLFNESIYYNIAYAQPTVGRDAVERAAALAHIHDFIVSLPQGYDTLVGERGLKLSGGEKQRIAIARVILKDPPILIFDEATSSLDSAAEQGILAALREVAEARTTLVIAHRLSTIVDAQTILVMAGGRIVERGDHAALLAQEGLYARLWRLQQRERLIPPLPDEDEALANLADKAKIDLDRLHLERST